MKNELARLTRILLYLGQDPCKTILFHMTAPGLLARVLKTMFAYKIIECLHQLLKSRHLIVRSISLNPYKVFQTWKSGNLESWKKGKQFYC